MPIVRDDLWFCGDCAIVACNGDVSGISSDDQIARVYAGLDELGPNLAANYGGDGYNDFSWAHCDCCGSHAGGERYRFAVLGESDERAA